LIWDLVDSNMPETYTFRIEVVISRNNIYHWSSYASVEKYCGTGYTISEATTPTNPQFAQHGGNIYGFALPSYNVDYLGNSLNAGCPVSIMEASQSSVDPHVQSAGLNNPTNIGSGQFVVCPSDSSLHLTYSFYLKATVTVGGTHDYFGPYVVTIGCTATSVSFSDDAANNFATPVGVYVGASTADIYTYVVPVPTRAWCIPNKNEIVNPDATGTTWTDPLKIVACPANPCNQFDLVDTINQETITFKVLSTFPGELTHLSATASIVVSCGPVGTYTASEVAAPTNPQFVTHGDASVGFTMPTYETDDWNIGCPVTTVELSATNVGAGAISVPSDITLNGGVVMVKPTNTALHQAYVFYAKVTMTGGSYTWFGPYTLNVGCFAGSVTYTDNAAFVPAVNLLVGDSNTGVYTLAEPTSDRAWCVIVSNVLVNTDSSAHNAAKVT